VNSPAVCPSAGANIRQPEASSAEPAQEQGMKERIDRHKDGSIKAKGHVIDNVLTGYWEWFRKDGTKMRSGFFENGKQVGEWTTYDDRGKVVKVTKMKSSR
jgi:antitoxin component YwqK of YwqJK toxin-antitoxin module